MICCCYTTIVSPAAAVNIPPAVVVPAGNTPVLAANFPAECVQACAKLDPHTTWTPSCEPGSICDPKYYGNDLTADDKCAKDYLKVDSAKCCCVAFGANQGGLNPVVNP